MSDLIRYPLSDPRLAVFVGQGPNQAAWDNALQRAPDSVRDLAEHERWASNYCARIAITGAIGRKIAALGGWKLDLRFGGYARANLNARWNGKSGKGDVFDRREGTMNAVGMLGGKWTHYVLLGAEVAACFGYKNPEWLAVHGRYVRGNTGGEVYKNFLLFPHPSGINSWWNDEINRLRASKCLREFLNLPQ